MARDDAQLRIRIPEDVKVWLEAQAKKNLRTQSAEIVLAIRAKMESELAKAPQHAGA